LWSAGNFDIEIRQSGVSMIPVAQKKDSPRYTARGLAELVGLSERTVRYYVAEGLLPPPPRRGRGAHFGEGHLTRLKLIRAMQQAGNDLGAIGEYLAELEGELKARGASLDDALAVWTARNERAELGERWRRLRTAPMPVHRYRIAEGVELLIDAEAAPAAARMQEIVRSLREAFEPED
jgi:DNA-binding transcriptional MerR regulator